MEINSTSPDPTPPAPAHADAIQNGNSELKSIFQESQNKFQNQKLESPKIKGRAGRKPLPRDAKGNKIRPGEPGYEAAMAAQAAQETQKPGQSPESPAVPTPDICLYLIDPIIAMSNIPAARHSIPELALNRTEAEACAHSIQGIIDAFIPDWSKMDPKTAAILSAGLTFGSLAVAKINIYSIKMHERMIQNQKIDENNNGVTATEVIHANGGAPAVKKTPAGEFFNNSKQ